MRKSKRNYRYLLSCICAVSCLFPSLESRAEEAGLDVQIYSGEMEIIAPGRSSENRVVLQNPESRTMDYILYIEKAAPEDIHLRISASREGENLLGGTDTWIEMTGPLQIAGTIEGNTQEEILVVWEWTYHVHEEQDEIDTAYGMDGTAGVGTMLDFHVWSGVEEPAAEKKINEVKNKSMSGTGKSTIVKAGDEMNILQWMVVFSISLTGLYNAFMNSRRTRKGGRL